MKWKYTACVIFSVTLVASCFVMLNYVVDSGWRRERAAKRIQQYAADVKAGVDAGHALQQMVDAAESSYRFERCYALGTLGELGERAEPALPVIIEGLKHSDGFVRHAAAQALYDMGRSAAGARDELITTLSKFPHHSSGMYAAQALGEIGDRSPEVLDALRFAGAKQQSLSTKSARKAYVKLTGEDLPEVK